MPEICLRYAWDMKEICMKYAWDLYEIFMRCMRFTQYIPETSYSKKPEIVSLYVSSQIFRSCDWSKVCDVMPATNTRSSQFVWWRHQAYHSIARLYNHHTAVLLYTTGPQCTYSTSVHTDTPEVPPSLGWRTNFTVSRWVWSLRLHKIGHNTLINRVRIFLAWALTLQSWARHNKNSAAILAQSSTLQLNM